MVTIAAAISQGWDDSDCWKAFAVPSKLPRTDTGTPSSAVALLMAAAVACDKDTPSGKLKLMVVAGVPLWWLTASGVLVVSTRAMAMSGGLEFAKLGPSTVAVNDHGDVVGQLMRNSPEAIDT